MHLINTQNYQPQRSEPSVFNIPLDKICNNLDHQNICTTYPNAHETSINSKFFWDCLSIILQNGSQLRECRISKKKHD